MNLPDMAVGSKPWAAKTVCDHYCGEGRPMRVASDGTPVVVYDCPGCSRNNLHLNLVSGTVCCVGRGCVPEVDYLGYVAEMEGLDLRRQRRAVQDKRREIIKEARDTQAASLTESLEQQDIDAELGPRESRYTPEQRRAALAELERREKAEEEARRREARERRKREDENRHRAALARVTNSRAAVTWPELLISVPLFFATLLASYYGLAALQDFADYSPTPTGLEGLGIPTEGSEPDSWLVAFARDLVGRALPGWAVLHRFSVALLLAAAVGGASWLLPSLRRRDRAALRDGEYVGVYDRDNEGAILWR